MKIIPMTEIFCDIDDFHHKFKGNLPKIYCRLLKKRISL